MGRLIELPKRKKERYKCRVEEREKETQNYKNTTMAIWSHNLLCMTNVEAMSTPLSNHISYVCLVRENGIAEMKKILHASCHWISHVCYGLYELDITHACGPMSKFMRIHKRNLRTWLSR